MEHAQPVKQSSGGWKQRLVFSAVVSAALAFTLCLFGPLDLFFNNYEELWFHFQDIIGGVAVIALILFLCCTLLGTLLRGKLHSIYMALMFGGLLGLYVQGSFMNKDYGSLDGTAVDWSAYTGYGVVNTLIWAVCILLPLVLMLVLREKKMRPVLLFLSCALIVMQGASLVVSYLNYPIRVFPVGRLDRESEGLLLLTSDGEIVNRLLRAVGGHEREYEVTVDRPVTREFVESMQAGVPILDTVTLPCRVRKTGEKSFNIVLVQGLNRQIRRMCEALGYRVTRLRRVRIMHIRLGDLRPGQWRELTQKELDGLEKAGIYRKTFS